MNVILQSVLLSGETGQKMYPCQVCGRHFGGDGDDDDDG